MHRVRIEYRLVVGICIQACIAPLLAQLAEIASLFCPKRSLADGL